jgi:hypothetical protein
MADGTYSQLLAEAQQAHIIRAPLYSQIEDLIERDLGVKARVIAYFTSFGWPVIISNADADMIEEVLRTTNMEGRELFLILNSGGGDGLAAERIVNICRTFGGGSFSVIVPKMAKSAATMICFGAKKIFMSETSELGPVDPQIAKYDDAGNLSEYQAAHEIVEAYDELIRKANTTKGRIEPFLQQLARFDARDIRRIISAQQLSANISIKALKSGMMRAKTEAAIKASIKPFLDPRHSISHGRPIYHDVVERVGLNVTVLKSDCELWRLIWSLYIRLTYHVSNRSSAKVIESSESEYVMPAPSAM